MRIAKETDQKLYFKVYSVSGKVSSLSVLSIENGIAKDIAFIEVINSFATVKARKQTFWQIQFFSVSQFLFKIYALSKH